MTVSAMLPLQQAVFTAVSTAVAGWAIPVYDHAPTNPPAEYIRLDGFAVSDISPKNGEIARHAFEFHHFLRPVSEAAQSLGQLRTKTVLAAVHAAVMGATLVGTRANHELLDIDRDEDGVTAHGRSRYTIIL